MLPYLLPLLIVVALSTEVVDGTALPRTKRRPSPASVPILEAELELNHPLARRQNDYSINGGPARGVCDIQLHKLDSLGLLSAVDESREPERLTMPSIF